MNTLTRNTLHWLPRALTILFLLFISMFALDILGEGNGIWETIVGLTMHLIPSLLILAALLIAWRRPLIGTAAFLALALISAAFFQGFMGPVMAAVFLLVGLLFALDGYAVTRPSPV
jgi:hypothetical protein